MASSTCDVTKKINSNKSNGDKGEEQFDKIEGKKKRKHREDAKEQLVRERVEGYEKLFYQAKKALYQQAKVAKSFECAKLVRKLKIKKDDNLQERLSLLKQFSLDMVVNVAIFRLGILNLNPNFTEATAVSKPNNQQEDFIEKLLSHKRLVAALEEWNDKVTQFRRWYLKRQDIVNCTPQFGDASRNKKQKAKKELDAGKYFVTLGTVQDDNYENCYDELQKSPVEKKNRPGQRARRAKAMAIEARKNGQILSKSINWRERKCKPDTSTHNDVAHTKPKKVEAVKIAEMGKTWKEQGNAHPSWAARSSENKGIVAFQGTKITFD